MNNGLIAVTRTALVTGGSRGIGAAIAAELRSRGVQVLTPSRPEMDLADAGSVDRWLSANHANHIDNLVPE